MLRLFLYYKYTDAYEQAYFSENSWEYNDPIEFQNWLNRQQNKLDNYKQVSYLFLNWVYDSIFISSPLFDKAILVLVAENFVSNYERLDKTFVETAKRIKEKLVDKFECLLPTTPVGMDLLGNLSEDEQKSFLEGLDRIIVTGNHALNVKDKVDARVKWLALLGNEFPPVKEPISPPNNPLKSHEPKVGTSNVDRDKPARIQGNAKSA